MDNDNDNYWINSEKYIKDIKKFFYIATDNDEKGNEWKKVCAKVTL
jgi:hypothetical protein